MSTTASVLVTFVYGSTPMRLWQSVAATLLVHNAPAISYRSWIQLIGHFPFVGIPVVAAIGKGR